MSWMQIIRLNFFNQYWHKGTEQGVRVTAFINAIWSLQVCGLVFGKVGSSLPPVIKTSWNWNIVHCATHHCYGQLPVADPKRSPVGEFEGMLEFPQPSIFLWFCPRNRTPSELYPSWSILTSAMWRERQIYSLRPTPTHFCRFGSFPRLWSGIRDNSTVQQRRTISTRRKIEDCEQSETHSTYIRKTFKTVALKQNCDSDIA